MSPKARKRTTRKALSADVLHLVAPMEVASTDRQVTAVSVNPPNPAYVLLAAACDIDADDALCEQVQRRAMVILSDNDPAGADRHFELVLGDRPMRSAYVALLRAAADVLENFVATPRINADVNFYAPLFKRKADS